MITAITLFLIAYLLYKYIIKPYRALLFYRRQGFYISFFPGIGIMRQFLNGIKKHNDSMYWEKNLAKQMPNLRGFAYNFGT